MKAESMKIALKDGLQVEVRRYAGGPQTPAICIPGLTRNAADFEDLAPKIAATGRDVVAISLRGRGRSDYDPEISHYFPTTYADDVRFVLGFLGWEKAVFVGTSLGGIITMLVNEKIPDLVAAAIINDVGPDLAPEGIARIAGYVGVSKEPAHDWNEAAERIKAINKVAFPDAGAADWGIFARRTFRESDDGLVLDYDPNIAVALAANGPAPDLWPAWASLKDTPTLLVHGEISDLLTKPIIDEMRTANSNFDYVNVPRIGHAPFMTEPAAWNAIEAFLKSNA